jgi:hypothetical protein
MQHVNDEVASLKELVKTQQEMQALLLSELSRLRDQQSESKGAAEL